MLFEIGTPDNLRVELSVADRDIQDIKEHVTSRRAVSQPTPCQDQKFELVVDRIIPMGTPKGRQQRLQGLRRHRPQQSRANPGVPAWPAKPAWKSRRDASSGSGRIGSSSSSSSSCGWADPADSGILADGDMNRLVPPAPSAAETCKDTNRRRGLRRHQGSVPHSPTVSDQWDRS